MVYPKVLFPGWVQTVLTQMLTPPEADGNREMLEAYLKLLAEAYQSTCALARNMQVCLPCSTTATAKLPTTQAVG